MSPTARPTASNAEAFARYQRIIASDLSRQAPIVDTGSEWGRHTQLAARWMARYTRRRDVILGPSGWGDPLTDQAAVQALIARRLAREAAFSEPPAWDEMTRQMVDRSLAHVAAQGRLDVSSVLERCQFGPSLRWLWYHALADGLDPDQAWQSIEQWASAMPPKPAPSVRKPRRSAEPAPQGPFARELAWQRSGDLERPWRTEVDGASWEVRLNDFPDERMYTLLVDDVEVATFDDWPHAWDRGDRPAAPPAPPPARAPAVLVHGRFLDRYQAGECAEVWAELVSLGPEVRKPAYSRAAVAVGRETMRRARFNVDLLIQRLDALGYTFWTDRGRFRDHRLDPRVWEPPTSEAPRLLRALERKGLVLPLSKRIWLEEVGRVDLSGSHPELCFLDAHGAPAVLADPLMVVPTADTLEDFVDLGDTEGLFVGFDARGKAQIAGTDQIDTAYAIALPNPAADAPLLGTEPPVTFVEHLREAFAWAGFPGWAQQPHRPDRLLAQLREGLLGL